MASQAVNSEINHAVIWGTTINVNDAMSAFRRFLNEFRIKHDTDDATADTTTTTSISGDETLDEPYYFQVFSEIKTSQVYNINIDCKNLYNFPPTRKLYTQLLHYPQEIIPIMDLVVHKSSPSCMVK